MRIFENANFDFIQTRQIAYLFSGALILASVISFAVRGIDYGIDFSGGMAFVIETSSELEATEVRSELTQVFGTAPEVKDFGQNVPQLLVRLGVEGETNKDRINEAQSTLTNAVEAAFPGVTVDVIRTDVVGPRFAEDLRQGALYAIFGALLVIFLYILIRFEWRFSMGAVAAVAHDVTITLGLFSLLYGILPFSLQIDQTIIAAFLTIVGYSLNDTVVVFDRVREYTALFKTDDYVDLVNRSINNTLSRTVVTSGTTLLVLTVLFIFGSDVLRGFAFALIVGVAIGTYSSVYVASPVVVELHLRAKQGAR
jgi:preprotein translocase SecF subunit